MLYPALGFGLGLRTCHIDHIIRTRPDVDWFEIISENFLSQGGRPHFYLSQIAEHYPLAMHGVGLSIGSADELNQNYLQQIKQVADRYQVKWVSDHLCWTHSNNTHLHDLMPLPFTEEALKHIVSRIQQVQDFLGRRLVLENVSSYITFKHSTISEYEFITAIAKQADCLILLDINNVYVNSVNHHFSAEEYLNHLPKDRVQQFHLAGHSHHQDLLIDTHDHAITKPVWDLYQIAVKRFGTGSTLIEWDDHIPSFEILFAELQLAKNKAQI